MTEQKNIITITDMQLLRAITGCVADKYECRYYLAGIQLNPNKSEAVGANGSILLRGNCLEQSDIPSIIVKLKTKIPMSAETGYFDLNISNLFVYNKSAKISVIPYQILDAKYPDVDRFMPTGKTDVGPESFAINPLLMVDMLKNAKMAAKDNFVVFQFQDKENGSAIGFKLAGIKTAHQGVIMPCLNR